MNETEYKLLKAKFLKIFANVPLPLRSEIIAVVDDESVSWSVACAEIKHDTDKAPIILKHLKEIRLL